MASVETKEAPDQPRQGQKVRLVAVLCLLTVCFVLLVGRLFQIQVLDHQRHSASAHRLLRATDPIIDYRGDIRTRDGVILARDVLAYEVGIDPRKVGEERLPALVRLLCDALRYPDERRWRCFRQVRECQAQRRKYSRIGIGVDPGLVREIRSTLPAILPEEERVAFVATASPRRVYPRDSFLASVVGATDVDGRGIEGVERMYDAYLSGRPGRRQVVKDAPQTTRVYFPEGAEVPPTHGFNIQLTLESRMQRILQEELESAIQKHRAEAGQGVIMDCRTGAVLALANWPTYDPNHFDKYPFHERKRRRKNRVVEHLYEPGSVMKPFVAAVALEKGVHGRHDRLWDGGRRLRLRHRTVEDVSDHGPITLEEAVVYSSNIGMSILGLKLGVDGLIETLERFQFCSPTGVDLPGERQFECKSRDQWSEEFTAVSVSFGYEVQVSPIRLCAAFASLINGGYLLRPRVVAKLTRGGEELVNPRQVLGRPIKEETSRILREILLRVVEEGSGQYVRLEGLDFGGKTGTADMGPRYTKTNYLASFEAFAPYEDPRFVAVVMIEKPRGKRYYGGWVAGPVVGRVLARLFHAKPTPTSYALKE